MVAAPWACHPHTHDSGAGGKRALQPRPDNSPGTYCSGCLHLHCHIGWGGKKTPGGKMPNTDLNITAMIESFVRQIFAAVEASTAERAQAALAGAFGFQQKRGPGRPAKQTTAAAVEKKKAPKQLCPVPGCKNPAAPVFG